MAQIVLTNGPLRHSEAFSDAIDHLDETEVETAVEDLVHKQVEQELEIEDLDDDTE